MCTREYTTRVPCDYTNCQIVNRKKFVVNEEGSVDETQISQEDIREGNRSWTYRKSYVETRRGPDWVWSLSLGGSLVPRVGLFTRHSGLSSGQRCRRAVDEELQNGKQWGCVVGTGKSRGRPQKIEDSTGAPEIMIVIKSGVLITGVLEE